jgi:protein tyrosine phosphatase (PTP) superfamily phosphohydrolase (DUF442 family)
MCLAAFCIAICIGYPVRSTDTDERSVEVKRLSTPNLPNAFRITEKIVSGGLPESPAAFEELRQLGVKTIISVDGAKPHVQLAANFGMRYVHLPHGYDGIAEERQLQLAKAVQDLPGPIYIHCHHGKHRSPAAAAVVGISLNWIPQDQAMHILETAGTSPEYRGLYESVRKARPRTTEELDAIPPDFPAIAKLPEMAESMVALDGTMQRLQLAKKAGWNKVASDPDIDPAHEALMLREHYTELLRTESIKKMSFAFGELMRQAEIEATVLEKSLRNPNARSAGNHSALSDLLNAVQDNCIRCHRQFRDKPLSEKSYFAPSKLNSPK